MKMNFLQDFVWNHFLLPGAYPDRFNLNAFNVSYLHENQALGTYESCPTFTEVEKRGSCESIPISVHQLPGQSIPVLVCLCCVWRGEWVSWTHRPTSPLIPVSLPRLTFHRFHRFSPFTSPFCVFALGRGFTKLLRLSSIMSIIQC